MGSESEASIREYFMHLTENRLASFTNWPHKGTSCTAEKMALAGFFHCPTDEEPDAVQCFACGKELDGWEPDDDPWKEHESHSSLCPFLKCKNPIEELTVEEFLRLYAAIQEVKKTKIIDGFIKDLKESAAVARKEMEKLGD